MVNVNKILTIKTKITFLCFQVKCLSEYCNITLSSLLQSSKYQVKIRAYNKAGFGKYSKIKSFTTESSKFLFKSLLKI